MIQLSLNGSWKVHTIDKSISIKATVPGTIHTDLLAAKKIADPFKGDNEIRQQWIGESDWVYERSFMINPSVLKHDKVLLCCEGLDTLATITINGKQIGKTNNMFHRWEFDVKKVLTPGNNSISVLFKSVMPYVRKKEKERHLDTPKCIAHEPYGRPWVRKEQCNFGWDWGPVLVTCGIWRSIGIIAYSTARINNVAIEQDHSKKGEVTLKIKTTVETAQSRQLHTAVRVQYMGNEIATVSAPLKNGISKNLLTIKKPDLWWPNGLGKQALYTVEVCIQEKEQVLDTWNKKIGLRTLVIKREKDDWGESFAFDVNGVTFFAKGANWIPADAFAPRVTHEMYHNLLKSAQDANMNMIRVWGGGIYEDEYFYDQCDELGLCVWQDLMYACSAYPSDDPAFMANVKRETELAVKSLRHHPSISLWCGNNELEMWIAKPTQHDWPKMPWQNYTELFDTVLPGIIKKLDPQRQYWPSSPHSPVGDRARDGDQTCGDIHLWDVWHGRKPFEFYRTNLARFCSEFGFQSFPEPKTVNKYTQKKDRNITSPFMEFHQRSAIGNTTIMHYMLSWMRMPVGFENTLWASQILQGLAMKYAVEHWRRNMPRCMGALYWQLNDCWPVASWSSIDYYGRWKALHYMARDFFAPLLISGVEDEKAHTIEIHVTSDMLDKTTGRMRWLLTDASGRRIKSAEMAVTVPANSSRKITTLDFVKESEKYGDDNLLLFLELIVSGKIVSRNLVHFKKPKSMDLPQPKISYSVKAQKNGAYSVTLQSDETALWAFLEIDKEDCWLSGNFINLRPGAPVVITAKPSQQISMAEFKRKLKVRSIVDLFREKA